MYRFVAAVQEAVQQSPYSMEYLARRLKKAPSTLYNELNPFDLETSTAKLGLEDAVQILEIIGDTSPLVTINDHFDLCTRSRNIAPDKSTLQEEILDNHPAIVAYEQSMLDCESIEEVRKKREVAINELEQDFTLYRDQLNQRAK